MAAVRTLWTYGKYDDGQIIKIYKLIGAYHDISDVLRQKRERRRRRRRVVIKMRAITLWSPENYRVPFPFWQVSNLRGWPRLVITCQSFLSPSFFRRSLRKKEAIPFSKGWRDRFHLRFIVADMPRSYQRVSDPKRQPSNLLRNPNVPEKLALFDSKSYHRPTSWKSCEVEEGMSAYFYSQFLNSFSSQ